MQDDILWDNKKSSEEDAWTAERVRRDTGGAFWLNKSRINIIEIKVLKFLHILYIFIVFHFKY
jgi:hypothetical protein